jgi:hypothetical protein
VRGLEQEYKGRIEFRFDQATSDAGKAARERNGWNDQQHGLEAVAPDGTVTGHLPGHNYGLEEIQAQIATLLKESAK